MNVTYSIGDYLSVKRDGVTHQFEIIGSEPKSIKLFDPISGVTSERKTREIDELIVSGDGIIQQKDKDTRKILSSNGIDFASYPEHLREIARDRLIFVLGILDRNLKSLSAKVITPYVESVYRENKFETLTKKPGTRTVQVWIKRYLDADKSIRVLLPFEHTKGNRLAKINPLLETYIENAIEYFKSPERPTVSKAFDSLKTFINYDNKLQKESEKLKPIALSAFIKRLEKCAKKELVVARLGKEEANKIFKLNQLAQKITFILQRVESDHTQADLFIVDSVNFMILGRPYITVLLDYKSKSILGFYIGFEKPSYLSIARALRHTILPKTYVKDKYPNVVNEWNCYGIPKILVVDRGKDFESIALMDACHDLNIRIQRNPARHPWYKGSVESFFKSVNQKLLQDMKGKVFPNIIDTNLYNPEKHAVISMDLFLELFHVWIVDIYQQDKVSKGTIIPSVSWREDLDSVPRRVMDKDALDIILSEKESRKNSENGIVLDFIWYDCPELAKLRAETGFKKVQIKYDRENLGQIFVLDEREPRDKKYFKVPAKEQKYAQNLSLHQHQVIKSFNRKKLDNEHNPESLACAKMKINELISDYLASTKLKKTSSNQKLARYIDIGQQTDQSVTSSVFGAHSMKKSIEQPVIQTTDSSDNELLNTFDGKNNTLPDKLDF